MTDTEINRGQIVGAVLKALVDRREYERVTHANGYLRPTLSDYDVAQRVASDLLRVKVG